MSHRVIGSCSNCGGAVCSETAWYSVLPQQPACIDCGAVAGWGPTVQTRKPAQKSAAIITLAQIVAAASAAFPSASAAAA